MNETTIFYLLLGIITFDFILERILVYLNRKRAKDAIPKELEGIYDAEEYARSQSYQREVSRFTNFSATISFILLFSAIFLGWFGLLDEWVRTFSPFEMASTCLFLGILYLASDVLIGIPFSLYHHFVIESRYGFNKMTVKTYWLDKLKNYFLTFLIGGVILSVMVYMVNTIGSEFWIYFWIFGAGFILFANMFYSSLILPLFHRMKPLEEGELSASIHAYSKKVRFPLKNIFVIDGSKRSSKGNAFFTGLGRKKKVILFDTLIEKHTVDELTAVFAHEIGHYKKKHIIFSIVFSLLNMGFILYLFSRMVYNAEVSWAMGGQLSSLHLNLLAFGILYAPISRIIGIVGNSISRKNEYEADAYARDTYSGQALIEGLKKLSADHLSNLTPHPAYVFVHYSHPPLGKRIKALN